MIICSPPRLLITIESIIRECKRYHAHTIRVNTYQLCSWQEDLYAHLQVPRKCSKEESSDFFQLAAIISSSNTVGTICDILLCILTRYKDSNRGPNSERLTSLFDCKPYSSPMIGTNDMIAIKYKTCVIANGDVMTVTNLDFRK